MIRALIRSAIERFPTAALFLGNSRDLLDRRDPPRMTPWGFTLAGHEAMAAGTFEPQETRLVRAPLQEVDMLVNVGANVGYYCCHALSLGKPVIAAEPIPRNLHYLLKNIRNNGWARQAQVFPVALGRDTDILEMWGGETGASLIKGWASISESYVTLVPVLSLDQLLGNSLRDRRGLILVDIEGAELMMLEGAPRTLQHHPRPIWMMEISSREHQPTGFTVNPSFRQTFDVFFRCGYRAYTADERQDEVIEEIVDKVAGGQGTLPTHNFIFR